MATLPRCLCLVLTLWMAVSRPSAATWLGRSGPSPWWGTQDEKQIRQRTLKFREAGDFAAAERTYREGFERAQQLHDSLAAIRYLTGVGASQVMEFKYRAAFDSLWNARNLALAARADLEIGAIAFNLSSLYLQIHDTDSALHSAEEGLNATGHLSHPYYEPQLLLQLGRIHAALDDGQAAALFASGIEAARSQGNIPQEAQGWDLLGETWLEQHRLRDAERALDHAFLLCKNGAGVYLPYSYGMLGALKLAQGDLDSAARFTDRAIASHSGDAEFLLEHQRGRIRLARGDVSGALADFSSAVDLASQWWEEVPPAASALASANVDLEQDAFDSFIETAADQSLKTGSSKWKVAAFQALEWNRAASLRESLALAESWRKGLPLEYWEVLAQLRSVQSALIQSGMPENAAAGRLRLKLTEMEAKDGLTQRSISRENFRTPTSLIHFQDGLSRSELFLSYFLGKKQSFVWAVTRDSVTLHRLPPGSRIQAEVTAFRDAIRDGRKDTRGLGKELYAALMGDLDWREQSKSQWLLSFGGALLNLPVAALVTPDREASYLIEKHSLQIVSGASLLRKRQGTSHRTGWMLAVGDPIYNLADERGKNRLAPSFTGWMAQAGRNAQLARLVASSAEVESGALNWQPQQTRLFEGDQARRDSFLGAVSEGPSIIHLATHVLLPPTRRSEAMIAFGIDDSGRPELLSTSDVAMLHVPGAVVVMTGCDSGSGEIRSGAGIFGLTRAWEMAGAGGVIDTLWPVRDSRGELFARFYRYLRTESTAEALRRSQTEMIQSKSWRASPGYWASYQLTGSER